MEIPKNLPVKELYADVAQPAAREVGKALADTVKAARFLLAPVEYVAAWRERWQRYLERISSKVPDKNLRGADPEIAGPILFQLLHAKEEGLLAEMFLNLLARAIDKDRMSEAHPAYGQIVAQLHPDEAIILYHLKKRWFAQTQHAERDPATGLFRPRTNVSNDFPVHELAFPANFYVYVDHLYHLGIAWMRQVGNQEVLFEGAPGVQTGVRINNAIELMGFGLNLLLHASQTSFRSLTQNVLMPTQSALNGIAPQSALAKARRIGTVSAVGLTFQPLMHLQMSAGVAGRLGHYRS